MSGPVVDEQRVSFSADASDTSPAATLFLDALRFIAANLIVLANVLLLFFDEPRGSQVLGAAVVIFFVLSGFLISRSLIHRAREPGRHIAAFLADRVARIMTPLVPVLLIVALLHATVLRTHWSLDGLETVAVLFCIYVAASLLVFGVLRREKIRGSYVWMLALASVPVVIWNAADGAAKALSLVWIVGALAGFTVVHIGVGSKVARSKVVASCVLLFGALALAERTLKQGFDPHELQTAFLMALIFLGLFLWLNQTARAWRIPAALARFFASYSYSLCLVQHTVLVLVLETTAGLPKAVSVCVGVIFAHAAALLVYQRFEKHHRAVGRYLRPIFARQMMRPERRADGDAVISGVPCDQLKP